MFLDRLDGCRLHQHESERGLIFGGAAFVSESRVGLGFLVVIDCLASGQKLRQAGHHLNVTPIHGC